MDSPRIISQEVDVLHGDIHTVTATLLQIAECCKYTCTYVKMKIHNVSGNHNTTNMSELSLVFAGVLKLLFAQYSLFFTFWIRLLLIKESTHKQ